MKILSPHFTLSLLACSLLSTGISFGQTTERVSVDSFDAQADGNSLTLCISVDGRYVAFQSYATNLVPGDTTKSADIFVHDCTTGVTELVSVDSLGAQANADSASPSISGDGRYVAFQSSAGNLVQGDTNNSDDIFVHDRTTGVTERVSVDSFGAQADNYSSYPSISEDGRYVVFESLASNLVTGDTNNSKDIFVHDRTTGITERVSVDSLGAQANHYSYGGSISGDGRYVAFESLASNLVTGDTNGSNDMFVHDRTTGATERVSVDSLGAQAISGSQNASISGNGRYVAFESDANNLVSGDTNAASDIFVHDRTTGMTERVSVDSFGAQGNLYSYYPSISEDGRYVAFHSFVDNLVPGDTNGKYDIFVHDRTTGVTERVSVDSFGVQGNSHSYRASLSGDGRYVAFRSEATNLVPGDTNLRQDIFVHDRLNGLGANSIYLSGPASSPVQTPLNLSWLTAPPSSFYWVAYAFNNGGSVVIGHSIDLSPPQFVLAAGINAMNGSGSYSCRR